MVYEFGCHISVITGGLVRSATISSSCDGNQSALSARIRARLGGYPPRLRLRLRGGRGGGGDRGVALADLLESDVSGGVTIDAQDGDDTLPRVARAGCGAHRALITAAIGR